MVSVELRRLSSASTYNAAYLRAAWRAIIGRWPVRLSEARATLDAIPASITGSASDPVTVETSP